MKSRIFLCDIICEPSQLVLVITCLGRQFGITDKLPKCIFENFEIARKLPGPNM